MTSIQDPEDSEAYAKLLAERDKLKAELERQIRFVREATDELEKMRAALTKAGWTAGSLADFLNYHKKDAADTLTALRALQADMANGVDNAVNIHLSRMEGQIENLQRELREEKGQHKITQEKRKEFEGYADRMRAELDELKKGQEELELEAIVQKARAEGHSDRADKAEAELAAARAGTNAKELAETVDKLTKELATERVLADGLVAAMRKSVGVGCTDHLDAWDDASEVWYGPLARHAVARKS
jgi:chromosome segregation ATPase